MNRSKTKAWYLLIVPCLIAFVVFWKNLDPRGPDYSFSSKESDPKGAAIELSKNDFSGESSRQDLAGLSDADYSEFKNSELALNAYLQAALVDEGISRSKTLRISRITETEDFAQYQVESTDGDPGIVTVSPGRVFAFLQTRDGVYEYSGDDLELTLNKSFMSGVVEDFRRPKMKTLAQ